MENTDNSNLGGDQEIQSPFVVTPYYTPYPKPALQKSDIKPINLNFSPSDSSGASMQEGSGSTLSSSSDSEPESFDPSVLNNHGMPLKTDGQGLPEGIKLKEEFYDVEQQNHEVGKENAENYDELLKKFIKSEEELNTSNLKLQLSEEEIIKLKIQIERSEDQLDSVRKELKIKEVELEHEKGKVGVAKEQLKISDDENVRLREELGTMSSGTQDLQGQLEVAKEAVATLESQLDSAIEKIRELEDKIMLYKTNETKHELEAGNLKTAMLNVQAQSHELHSKIEELECKSTASQNKLRQVEAENLKLQDLHAAQEKVLQGEISCLKDELGQRRHDVEAVNKHFDRLKLKYDMLITEQNEANAEIQNLKAVVSSRDDQIANMEMELLRLHAQNSELVWRSEDQLNLVNNLKLKVEELENEVTRQNSLILDRAEEKREAIRQLCFALNHYKSEFQELLQAFTGHKLHAVTAS